MVAVAMANQMEMNKMEMKTDKSKDESYGHEHKSDGYGKSHGYGHKSNGYGKSQEDKQVQPSVCASIQLSKT